MLAANLSLNAINTVFYENRHLLPCADVEIEINKDQQRTIDKIKRMETSGTQPLQDDFPMTIDFILVTNFISGSAQLGSLPK